MGSPSTLFDASASPLGVRPAWRSAACSQAANAVPRAWSPVPVPLLESVPISLTSLLISMLSLLISLLLSLLSAPHVGLVFFTVDYSASERESFLALCIPEFQECYHTVRQS